MFSSFTDSIAPVLNANGEYPTKWSELVGQEPAKRMLQVAVKAAKIRKKPLEHTLISHGSPGLGKTALASLVATSQGGRCRVVSGEMDANKARLLFADMEDGDVLFYDEFHQVMDGGRKKAEWLLTYLQDGTIPGPFGAEVQPRVTIIAATTDPGKLTPAIVSRFPIRPPMQEYTDEEATKLAQAMAKKILGEYGLKALGKADAMQLAAAASNNPRAIKRLLVVLRDMTLTNEIPMKGSRYNVDALLEWQGITADGLDSIAQEYLTCIVEMGGKAGAKAIEDRLQQAGGLGEIERLLQNKGLIARTATGRVLTQDGIKRVRALLAAKQVMAA